ncbi:MAG: hypothetical protein ABR903_01420, partial [Thermodesulfovibrionales bacterium]
MISNRNRELIFTTLFVINFIFYAISPLSSTFTEKNDSTNSSGLRQAAAFSENIHIWSWEMILSRFSIKDDSSESPSTIRVLMRKVRAIIPDDTIMKSMPLAKNGATPENLFLG